MIFGGEPPTYRVTELHYVAINIEFNRWDHEGIIVARDVLVHWDNWWELSDLIVICRVSIICLCF